MAHLFADSFNHYATADIGKKWTGISGAPTIQATGRNATSSMRFATQILTSVSANASKAFTATGTIILGVALNPSSLTIGQNGRNGAFRYIDGTEQVSWKITPTGAIEFYRGPGTTLLGTTLVCLAAGSYTYVEMKVTISDTVGAIEVRANGLNVLTLTGLDTRNATAASTVSDFWIGVATTSGSGAYLDIDDLYFCDTTGPQCNDFYGAVRVFCQLPSTGDGTHAAFVPSSGTDNGAMVDEVSQDGDTTYNTATAAGDIDTYNYAPLGIAGNVLVVQINQMVRSAGAGSEQIRGKYRVAGTTYSGTTTGVSTSYTDVIDSKELNPATGVAWTIADVDAAEFGTELVS